MTVWILDHNLGKVKQYIQEDFQCRGVDARIVPYCVCDSRFSMFQFSSSDTFIVHPIRDRDEPNFCWYAYEAFIDQNPDLLIYMFAMKDGVGVNPRINYFGEKPNLQYIT